MQCPNCGKSNESTYVGFSSIECANDACISWVQAKRVSSAGGSTEREVLRDAIEFCAMREGEDYTTRFPSYYTHDGEIRCYPTKNREGKTYMESAEVDRIQAKLGCEGVVVWSGLRKVLQEKLREIS